MDARAYIRVFVDRAERWADLTDAQYRTLDLLHLHAVEQLPRGFYRSLAVAQAFLPPLLTDQVPGLIDLGLVTVQDDGRLYLVGWTEDQEGDWQVVERVRRHRAVQRGSDPVTPTTVTGVTPTTVITPGTPAMHRAGGIGHVAGDGPVTPRPVTPTTWDDFTDPAWGPFREAWTARGLHLPPTDAQRKALWPVVDAQPNAVGTWVREARQGAKASEVVGHVLTRWRAIQDGIPPDPPRKPRPTQEGGL